MRERIAVLGAGPMGLAVAYQLAKDGHHPVVFEADDRVGGMAASFDFNGINIERYYHFHCVSDEAFEEVLRELGIHDHLIWVTTQMGYWFEGKLQPWGTPWALLRFKGLGIVAKTRYGLHTYFSIKRNKWKNLDQIDAASWIRHWVGKRAFDVLWRDLFEYKFHHLAENVSAAWIWSRIRRIGRSRSSIFHEKLGYLEGGSQTLLDALSTAIEQDGGQINLSSRIEKVVIDNNKVQGVQVNNQFYAFDKVISTVPVPFLSRMIPDLSEDIKRKFDALENIAVVCVIVKLRKRVTRFFWVNTNDPAMDIPGLVEYTNLRQLENHIVYVPFYLPQTHETFLESDSAFEKKVMRYLKLLNSNIEDDDFIDVQVNRYRYAQPICQPGHLTNLPPISLPIDGLWAADTSYYYPEDRGISESIAMGRQIARDVGFNRRSI